MRGLITIIAAGISAIFFAIGVAKILFPIFGAVSWLGFAIQVIICAVGMGMISQLSSNDYVEECGRGAIKQLAKWWL